MQVKESGEVPTWEENIGKPGEEVGISAGRHTDFLIYCGATVTLDWILLTYSCHGIMYNLYSPLMCSILYSISGIYYIIQVQ